MLQALTTSELAVDAGSISLKTSVDVNVATVAALAAVIAGELGATATSVD